MLLVMDDRLLPAEDDPVMLDRILAPLTLEARPVRLLGSLWPLELLVTEVVVTVLLLRFFVERVDTDCC